MRTIYFPNRPRAGRLRGKGAGLALYRRMGFSPVGVYHEQGKLDGRWVDVLIMEQLL